MRRVGLIKEHGSLVNVIFRLTDLVWAFVSGLLAKFIYDWVGEPDFWANYWVPIAFSVVLVSWLFPRFRLYQNWRGQSLVQELRSLTLAWSTIFLILSVSAVLSKTGAHYSRVWGVLWFLMGWVLLVGSRVSLRVALLYLRRKGYNLRTAVVVGGGELASDVVSRLGDAAWTGIQILGYFSRDDELLEHAIRLGDFEQLADYTVEHGVDQIWIALPLREESLVQSMLHDLRHTTATIRYVPDIFGFRLLNHSISEVAGLPVVDITASPMEGVNRLVKAIEDRVLAFFILFLISPLMLLIAVMVKISSPGPVFYRQERVGWNGKLFVMLKFRSMRLDSEKGDVKWGGAKEKPVTAVGVFLRRTSLDELPQFINVLKGDMSIVGPRPERPVFVEQFKDEIPDYMKKHLVKAGITGWAQVNGWRGDTDLNKRIEYDLYYIEHWSLWFDIKIIFLTLLKGLVSKHAY